MFNKTEFENEKVFISIIFNGYGYDSECTAVWRRGTNTRS